TKTGPMRLRAGLPAEWRSGNKTGTGRTEGTTISAMTSQLRFRPAEVRSLLLLILIAANIPSRPRIGIRRSSQKWEELRPSGLLASRASDSIEPRPRWVRPNNSFKPNLLRYSKGVAEKACHA